MMGGRLVRDWLLLCSDILVMPDCSARLAVRAIEEEWPSQMTLVASSALSSAADLPTVSPMATSLSPKMSVRRSANCLSERLMSSSPATLVSLRRSSSRLWQGAGCGCG